MALDPGDVTIAPDGSATGSGLSLVLYQKLETEYDATPPQTPGNVPGAQKSLAKMARALGQPLAEEINEHIEGEGPAGATGPTGPTGAAGVTGVTGVTGATGATGAAGIDGATGATGLPGEDGIDGMSGPPGPKGDKGDPGAPGLPGEDGIDGMSGPPGPNIIVSPGQVIGSPTTATSNQPAAALTGLQQGENIRREFFQLGSAITVGTTIDNPGTYNDIPLDARTSHLLVNPLAGDCNYTGFAHGIANTGAWFLLCKEGADGRIILKHNAGSIAANQIWCPNDTDLVLQRSNDAAIIWYAAGRWRCVALSLPNNYVTLAMLATLAAGRVIGSPVDASGSTTPVALTGQDLGSLVRRYWYKSHTTPTGTIADYVLVEKEIQIHFNVAAAVTIGSFTVSQGRTLEIFLETGSAPVTLKNENAGSTLGLIRTPSGTDLTLYAGDGCTLTHINNRYRVTGIARRVDPNAVAPATATIGGILVVIPVTLTAGTPGTPDDVAVFNGNAPWPFEYLGMDGRITTGIAASTLEGRSASGGLGSSLTDTLSSATAGIAPVSAQLTSIATVAAGGSLFIRRSDRGVGGKIYVRVLRT